MPMTFAQRSAAAKKAAATRKKRKAEEDAEAKKQPRVRTISNQVIVTLEQTHRRGDIFVFSKTNDGKVKIGIKEREESVGNQGVSGLCDTNAVLAEGEINTFLSSLAQMSPGVQDGSVYRRDFVELTVDDVSLVFSKRGEETIEGGQLDDCVTSIEDLCVDNAWAINLSDLIEAFETVAKVG